MKTEIKLIQGEFNEVIRWLNGRREFIFDMHQATYGDDGIVLHYFFEYILCDYRFDLAEIYINI